MSIWSKKGSAELDQIRLDRRELSTVVFALHPQGAFPVRYIPSLVRNRASRFSQIADWQGGANWNNNPFGSSETGSTQRGGSSCIMRAVAGRTSSVDSASSKEAETHESTLLGNEGFNRHPRGGHKLLRR